MKQRRGGEAALHSCRFATCPDWRILVSDNDLSLRNLLNSGLPETRPRLNRNRLCCQGHPSHRMMGDEQLLLKSAKAFFQQCRLEGGSSWQLGLSWKHVLWVLCPPSPPAAACFRCRTPSPPCTHPAQGAPRHTTPTQSSLELMHRGRCGPYCPPPGKGQEVLWLAHNLRPGAPPRCSSRGCPVRSMAAKEALATLLTGLELHPAG